MMKVTWFSQFKVPILNTYTVNSPISRHLRCREFCPSIRSIHYLESRHFLSNFGPTKISGYFLAIKNASEALAGSLQTNEIHKYRMLHMLYSMLLCHWETCKQRSRIWTRNFCNIQALRITEINSMGEESREVWNKTN